MTLTQLAKKHNLEPESAKEDVWLENAKAVMSTPEFQAELAQAIEDARAMSDALDKARQLTWADLHTPINI